jgi:hypothetical protein
MVNKSFEPFFHFSNFQPKLYFVLLFFGIKKKAQERTKDGAMHQDLERAQAYGTIEYT